MFPVLLTEVYSRWGNSEKFEGLKVVVLVRPTKRGLLNTSVFSSEFSHFPDAGKHQTFAGVFKKALCLTRPTHARQDVPFLGQDRRGLGAQAYTEYVRTTKARERRWRTQRLREGMLFQQAQERYLGHW